MFVLDLPNAPPSQEVPIIIAEANQAQRNGAWNAPYPAGDWAGGCEGALSYAE